SAHSHTLSLHDALPISRGEERLMSKRIDISDLNVYYSDFLAVEGVNMSIEPRSVTALIGPSGCGKSTFLRTLNRMHEVIPGAREIGRAHVELQSRFDIV